MHWLRARIQSDQSEPWRFLVGALLPGVVLSLMVAGPFGLDLPTTRGSYFDTAGDFSMSIASMQHAVRAPWGEIFAPSTFEGGVHLSVSDSYLLLLPLVRLLGNVDAPINLLIVVVPIIAALGLALIARCLGVRGGLAACSIAVIAVGWPPFLLTFLGHELWPHLASVGLMTISMAIAIQIARRSSPALIPLGAAVTLGGFLLSPYLGVICGLLLAGATIDALGSRRRTPITLSAVGSLGAILLLLGLMGWFAPGYDRLSDGYPGYVSQNLLGGILPIGCERCAPGYSIPAPEGQDPTTYSFAGAGGVVLTLIGIGLTARATLGWLRARRRPRYLGLAAALLVGSVYALGPELTLGPWVLGEIPTPLAEINRALTTLFRNRWFFAWPMLLFLMAVGAAWLVRRRHGAIVLSILAVAQILWAQPLLANAGTYRDPLQTPWDGLFARVAELSPGGMIFAEPMRCSRELLGDPYGELFVITHAATAATGRAGLPILGVRTVRVPDEIGCNRPESELRERHATGMTLILGGGLGDRSPARALHGITCWALPLIAVCPGRSPEALGETDFVRRFGLPVDTSSGAPIIPGRLSGDRIAAAVSLSGTGWRLADGIWREDIRAVGQVHGMRPRIPSGVRATLRISWDRNDGDTIRLRTVDEDGLLLPDHVIEGVCDTTRCRIDELLPLTTTRAYLIEIRVEARD